MTRVTEMIAQDHGRQRGFTVNEQPDGDRPHPVWHALTAVDAEKILHGVPAIKAPTRRRIASALMLCAPADPRARRTWSKHGGPRCRLEQKRAAADGDIDGLVLALEQERRANLSCVFVVRDVTRAIRIYSVFDDVTGEEVDARVITTVKRDGNMLIRTRPAAVASRRRETHLDEFLVLAKAILSEAGVPNVPGVLSKILTMVWSDDPRLEDGYVDRTSEGVRTSVARARTRRGEPVPSRVSRLLDQESPAEESPRIAFVRR